MKPAAVSLSEAQEFLAKIGARLSGSRARGDHRGDSDWDYYLPFRSFPRLRAWLKQRSVPFDSPVTGAVTFWPEGVQVEVSDLFPIYRRGLDR